jgi:hypothetical protein
MKLCCGRLLTRLISSLPHLGHRRLLEDDPTCCHRSVMEFGAGFKRRAPGTPRADLPYSTRDGILRVCLNAQASKKTLSNSPVACWTPSYRTPRSKEEKPKKNPAAVALGRLGGLKGGAARAAKLSPAKRKAIAKKAAAKRWAARQS